MIMVIVNCNNTTQFPLEWTDAQMVLYEDEGIRVLTTSS